MTVRKASLVAELTDRISGPAKGASGALKGLGASADGLKRSIGASSPQIGKLVADLDRLKGAQKALGDYREAGRSWLDLGKRLRSTQADIKTTLAALDEAKKKVASFDGVKSFARGGTIAREMSDARKEVSRLQATYDNLKRDAVGLGAAFEKQGAATRGLKANLVAAGVSLKSLGSAESGLRASIAGVNAELARQTGLLSGAATKADALARASKGLAAGMGASGRRTLDGLRIAQGMASAGRSSPASAGTMAGGAASDPARSGFVDAAAGVGAGALLKNTYERAKTGWLDMDEATRRQRAILGIDEQQQKSLYDQAVKIGMDTRFSNPDVVKAQTRIGSSLPDHLKDPKVISAITENSKNYALAMGTTMDQASEALLGRMLGLRMDMASPAAAEASSKEAANKLVQFAKSSGADHNDVMGYTKYGAAPGSVGGFSPEFSDALAAQLRRIGYEGSMGGNFVRAGATKLAVPTSKGLAALAAAGINHSDYVKQGGELSAENLNSALKLKFGKGLNANQQARIHALMQDESVVGDREEFVPQVSAIVQETLARRTKKGGVHAQDAERIAKSVNDYLSASAGAVDIQRLMRDVIAKGMTPALAKYLFGQEHGGRAQALDLKTLDKDTEAFRNTPKDRAEKVGTEINAGAYGAHQRYTGSIETFYMRLGQVADGPLTRFYDTAGNVVDRISSLPNELLGMGIAAAGAAASLLALRGAASVGSMLGVPGAAAVAGAVPLVGVAAGTIGAAGFAGYATSQTMPKVAAEKGAAGIDPATGGAMEGVGQHSGPQTPVVRDWWRKHMPTFLGGDAASAPTIAPKTDPTAFQALEQKMGEVKDKAGELNGLTISIPATSTGLGTIIQQMQQIISLGPQVSAAPTIAPKTDPTAFQALEQKMGEVKDKAGELNGLTISIPATSTGLGTIIQQMQQIISLGPQVSAAMNAGTGGRTGRVAQAFANSPSAGEA